MEGKKKEQQENKALLFQLAVSNSFKLLSESVSKDEFREALTLLKSSPKVAEKLHNAMIKELCDSMTNDLEDILNDGCLQEALTKVSDLSEQTDIAEYENAWRPPGNVQLHLRSFDVEKIEEETRVLEEEVNGLESENARLMKEVAEGRSKVRTIENNVTQCLERSRLALEYLGGRLDELEKSLKILQDE